tara:strand:- start:6396 stop:6821 length:426 start_codon:yes stop_codon:yes gene_type:complete
MVLNKICPPALIYLVFSMTQVTIDTMQGAYNKAFIKLWVTMIFTILLNHLCMTGLGIVSWLIVFIPFILMSVIVTLLLFMFGLDPETGKLAIYDESKKNKRQAPPDPREMPADYKMYEEPEMSKQQEEVLNNMIQRRTGKV